VLVYCGSVTTDFDSAYFRAVLGHVPTSVVVITGCDTNAQPVGITIGSFASVSLDPPLVGFFPGLHSRSWAAIKESGKFCVNVLGADQEQLCWTFAKEGDDKFAGLTWSSSPMGQPLLDGVIASIDCVIESETVAGDHYFVLGRVVGLEHAPSADNAMVFFRGKVTRAQLPE
jgi:3-hydroxy-9,10-secoandrosta-1,3,5(10)-triene-9,17-dione monooxygenase reductase component